MTISLGSSLIGVAFAIVVVAYLARPFRPAQSIDFDRATEIWVTQARATHERPPEEVSAPRPASDEEPVNFCSKCGRRVTPEDHFCPGCGKALRGGV